jgi:hypothetical protein
MRRLFAIGAGLLILGILALVMPIAAFAQQPVVSSDASVITVNPASKARIELVGDNWDFGSIPKGSIVSHAYKIKNVGEDTLQILKVKPTCGCTTAPLSSNSIAPGEEADLTANFNSEKFNGRVNKQINIDTSDPIRPYLKVIFTAIINNPMLTVTPEPAEVDFGSVKPGSGSEIKISVTNGEDKAVKLDVIEQGKAIKVITPETSIPARGKVETTKVRAQATSIPAHGKVELTLTLAPQGIQGIIQESVTLEVDGLPNSRFSIPCKANIAM